MPSVISDAAVLNAFAPFEPHESVALAVSGGPDSMAMMSLMRRWLALAGRDKTPVTVVTVDHRLRAESKSEAEFVARQARALGFCHAALAWTVEKPGNGIQAAAREARYGLMTQYCRTHSITCLATAHTEDDQAETLLMRLRRGSGLDGLAGIAPISQRGGITLVRPLLGLSKARLLAYLRSHGIGFVRDPSNENTSFERVRLRQAMAAFAGAGITRTNLARSALRLRRSADALNAATDDFLSLHFRVTPLGQGQIGDNAFRSLPGDLALRALSRVLTLVGGTQEPPRMSRVERLLERLRQKRTGATLGGCLAVAGGGEINFYREPRRMSQAELTVQGGEELVWDGRFLLTVSNRGSGAYSIKPLGQEGWLICRKRMKSPGQALTANRIAALATPSLWTEETLVCAPALDFVDAGADAPPAPLVTAELVPTLARFLKAI